MEPADLADARGMERGLKRGFEQGIEQGLERGLELEKMDVIQNLLAKGCDWAFIESIAHLDQAGYEALKAKYAVFTNPNNRKAEQKFVKIL